MAGHGKPIGTGEAAWGQVPEPGPYAGRPRGQAHLHPVLCARAQYDTSRANIHGDGCQPEGRHNWGGHRREQREAAGGQVRCRVWHDQLDLKYAWFNLACHHEGNLQARMARAHYQASLGQLQAGRRVPLWVDG